MKVTTLQPEHAIAVRWLNYCERTGTTHRISDPATFRFHIAEAKEEGELRANCREIDHAETVAIARERIASGKWPKTLANFTAQANQPAAEKAEPVKVADFRGKKTYRYGAWMIYVDRTNYSEKAGCGLRNRWSITGYYATHEDGRTRSGVGGIRDAVKDLDALSN